MKKTTRQVIPRSFSPPPPPGRTGTMEPLLNQPRDTNYIQDTRQMVAEARQNRLLEAEIRTIEQGGGTGAEIVTSQEAEMMRNNGFWTFMATQTGKDPGSLSLTQAFDFMKLYGSQVNQPIPPTSDAALVKLIEIVGDRKHDPPPPQSSMSELATIIKEVVALVQPKQDNSQSPEMTMLKELGFFDMVKDSMRPSEYTGQPMIPVGANGQVLAVDDLIRLTSHTATIRQQQEEWQEKKTNMRTARESVPIVLNGAEILFAALGDSITQKRVGEKERPDSVPVGYVKIPCPTCGKSNIIPKDAVDFICSGCKGVFEDKPKESVGGE